MAARKIPRLTERDLKRFWAKVDRSGGPDACHPWTGCRNENGYGLFKLGGRMEKAHRIAWCVAGNEITEEKPSVLHDCPGGDLPACCNDRHLWAGTQPENQRDMALKGRGARSGRGLPFGASPIGRKFMARVWMNGKTVYLGIYGTAEEASAVALAAKKWRSLLV